MGELSGQSYRVRALVVGVVLYLAYRAEWLERRLVRVSERLIRAEMRNARLSETLRWLHANGTQFSWQRDLIDRALRGAGDGEARGDG